MIRGPRRVQRSKGDSGARRLGFLVDLLDGYGLAAVIRGDTPHFDYVAGEAVKGIGQVAAQSGVPVAFGVLTCNTLEQAISPGPFVLGDNFSAADVYLGSAIGWGLMMKALEPRPAFGAYLGRLAARPAYQRFTAQNAELEKKKA